MRSKELANMAINVGRIKTIIPKRRNFSERRKKLVLRRRLGFHVRSLVQIGPPSPKSVRGFGTQNVRKQKMGDS